MEEALSYRAKCSGKQVMNPPTKRATALLAKPAVQDITVCALPREEERRREKSQHHWS